MDAVTASQWLIDQRYLNCSPSEMGTWCKKSLPVTRGKTEFLTSYICPDICCTVSSCMFSQNFASNIRYNKATTLLIFGLKGYSDFRFADTPQKCTVREGDVWLINTGGTEICRHTPAGIHTKMSVIKYSTERINNAFKASDDICMLISNNQMIRLGHQESPDQWISDLVNNPMLSATDRLLAEARALELIARWISPAQPAHTAEDPSLQAITNLLIRDLAHPPSLSELAREAGMSHTRLNRQFKKHYGATVFDWLRRYRMQRACTYLRDPQRSITDIAFQCGFSSASHFAQSFKKQFGHSPSEYRGTDSNR